MKQQYDSSGFSAVEALLIIALIAMLGFTGWYVWRARQVADKNLASSSSSTPIYSKQTPSGPTFSKLPGGFSEYKADAYGLRFGYPTEAGTMAVTGKAGVAFAASTPDKYSSEHNWDGSFSLNVFDKAGFTFGTAKYGATIKPENGKWVVVAVNPADTHKVGDVYAMPEKKINGGVAYEFTDNDEGYPLTRWLIELNNGYAIVSLPHLITQDMSTNPVTTANRDAYTQLARDTLASFTKF